VATDYHAADNAPRHSALSWPLAAASAAEIPSVVLHARNAMRAGLRACCDHMRGEAAPSSVPAIVIAVTIPGGRVAHSSDRRFRLANSGGFTVETHVALDAERIR
jgi:hypothetical protein